MLFGASAVRAGVSPRAAAAWGYMVALPLPALLAPLADTVLTSGLHVVSGVTLMWLAADLYAAPAVAEGAVPTAVR
ncbi:hypothetical protein ABZZ79_34645 [Streptomyces sp. NPDC006458]|uniref:hypothetical protein n=1 Tax=Streptomyces sp. NPDC006458 TaxID=3154302 RepID=UPI0033BF3045